MTKKDVILTIVRSTAAVILIASLSVSSVTEAQTAGPTGEIAYTHSQDERNRVFVMAADGSNPHALTDSERDTFLPLWSPNGEKIIFFENLTEAPLSERPPLRLMVMNADGSDLMEIARSEEKAASNEG